jgi:hypothetical protein
MEQSLLQEEVFNKIKSVLPPHLSLASAVANALHISEDSAYRRIRGEKPLSLPEFEMLCSKFQ